MGQIKHETDLKISVKLLLWFSLFEVFCCFICIQRSSYHSSLSLFQQTSFNVRCSTFGLMCWVGNGADSCSVTVTLLSNLTHCRFKSRAEWIMTLQRLMFPSRSYSFPHHTEAEQLFTADILCRVRSSHLSVKSAKCFPKSQRVLTWSDAGIAILIQSGSLKSFLVSTYII